MAGSFKRPANLDYDYSLAKEKKAFDKFFVDRGVPAKKANELDVATWNIANFGAQKRRDKELKLIAHILGKFDIIAVQELRADMPPLEKLMGHLGDDFDVVFTDVAGAGERLAVVYRNTRLEPGALCGELDYNPNGKVVNGKYVMPPKKQSFSHKGTKYDLDFYNFNRNPFLSSWKVLGTDYTFQLVNVHIYFGKESTKSAQFKNRMGEVFYLAEWARSQQTPSQADKVYERRQILLGDMNIPKMDDDDPVFAALKRRGMEPTAWSTQTGSTLKGFTAYDQIVFTNKLLKVVQWSEYASTVIDYDNFIFKDLWKRKEDGDVTLSQFRGFVKWGISDHRPLFTRLVIG